MDDYCGVGERIVKLENKSKHHEGLSHNELDNCIQTKCNVKKPVSLDIDEVFNEYVINHNKQFEV